jgi:1-carboxybiuret hydrolase subunit AtzG-like protein
MAVKRGHSRAKSRKAPRARATKAARAKSKTASKIARKPIARDPLDAFVDAAAHALALPVEPAWKGAVKANLAVTLALAASFADFPLSDDAEPAPVFTA